MSCKPTGFREETEESWRSSAWTFIARSRKPAFLQDEQVIREERVDLIHDRLVRFGKSLSVEDEVVIEATGNSAAVERILGPFVKRVVVAPANGSGDRLCPVKTDKIDAVILAKLHAGGFLPEVGGCGRQ